jgi:hypothetical protein
MDRDNVDVERPSTGRLTSGIEPKTGRLVLKTVSFVKQQLAHWRDDPDRQNEESEDKLNLQLCKFLDSNARNDFPMVRFDHEEYQVDRRRVDLSASPVKTVMLDARLYTIYDPILVLECKRFPAPPPKEREMEYVTGGTSKSGGIQRFKLGLHGADLVSAMMIAYVQQESPRRWFYTVNKWISELAAGMIGDICTWNESELLQITDEYPLKGLMGCKSVHRRIDSITSSIQLYHFGIAMNIKKPNEQSD